MNAPNEPVTRPASASGLARRIAATVIIGGVVFLLMWLMAFSVFTSLLTAAGCCVVVVAASAASDPVEMVLDAIAALVFGVLGASLLSSPRYSVSSAVEAKLAPPSQIAHTRLVTASLSPTQ
jgi:hypothetical protein